MLQTKLSYFANRLQTQLFPLLESHYESSLMDMHYKVIRTLELLRVERFIYEKLPFTKGRPTNKHACIARAFIAKHVLRINTTSDLIYRLQIDKNLRYICGWAPGQKIPSESTFSRVFADISHSKILETLHQLLIQDAFEDHIILHCGRDSMPVAVRERDNKELLKKNKENRERRSKRSPSNKKLTVCEYQALKTTTLKESIEELPTDCDIGKKIDANGVSKCWRGYKLHMDIAEGKYPLSCILTSASTHDCQAAIPLSRLSSSRAKICYELMDSAYDANAIRGYIESEGRIPLMRKHRRRGGVKEEVDNMRKAGRALNWMPANEARLSHRFADERVFARLLDSFLGYKIYVRKHEKVMCHVMLGVLCLLASELLDSIKINI